MYNMCGLFVMVVMTPILIFYFSVYFFLRNVRCDWCRYGTITYVFAVTKMK